MTPALPADTGRIVFRRPATSGGFIDAAWWPHTDDLAAELPELLEPLWALGREITRVSYHLGAWQPVGRRIAIGGRRVRLGGFHVESPLVVSLFDAWGRERVEVLVIAPATDAPVAARALALAATPGGTATAAQIMAEAGSVTAAA